MEEEIWRDIPDYEGLYQVSNKGRVKSIHFGKEKIRKATKHNKRWQITLCKDGQTKTYRVYRLEYEAFYGRIPEGMVVNHLNENSLDDNLSNLEICTQKENLNWGTHNQRMIKSKGKPVLQYDLNRHFIKEWESAAVAQKVTGISAANIGQVCMGKRKTAGTKKESYIWEFKKREAV